MKNLIAGIYEDRHSFFDRYTVVLKSPVKVQGKSLHQAFSISADAKRVHWLMVFYSPDGDNSHLGREVSFENLPEEVRKAIEFELKDFKGENKDGLQGDK